MVDGKQAPVYSEFIEMFQEFENLPESKVQMYLDMSVGLLHPPAWADQYFYAIAYETAHALALEGAAAENGGMGAGVGQVNSVSAAGMSTSFSQQQTEHGNHTDFWYSKTVYGQMFLRLRSTVIAPGMMT